ncbi:DUF4158 domain-containing protein [Streptomyces sp. NPDC020951]|uniref:DUF4158 domain-containing protein n=1 Tax=Streptomyces sp. NPDC020951 TaxID=3365104 RepID=UPI0037995798
MLDHFTLSSDEAGRLWSKTGATRPGFAVRSGSLTWRGRFPRVPLERPPDAVEHVARQAGVAASGLVFYDFTSRAVKRHRDELRDLTGWRECTKTGFVELVSHLADVIWHDERREEQVRAELLRQMRAEMIEPPTAAQGDTIIRSALHQADERAVAEACARLAAGAGLHPPPGRAGIHRTDRRRPRSCDRAGRRRRRGIGDRGHQGPSRQRQP